jgi:TRAP-type uncharacterized transport system fused permease subunit
VTAIVGVLMLSVAAEGYVFARVAWPLRIVLAAGAILMLSPDFTTDAIGVAVALAVVAWQWRLGRREPESGEAVSKEPTEVG